MALLVAQLRVQPANLVEGLLQFVAPTDGGELRLLVVGQPGVALTRREARSGGDASFHVRNYTGRGNRSDVKAAG